MQTLSFAIDKNSKIKFYHQLYDKFVESITSGILKPGTKLPSVRDLSKELDISRNTVTKAYSLLGQDKFIYSRNKSGFYVADASSSPGTDLNEAAEDSKENSTVPTVESILRQRKNSILQEIPQQIENVSQEKPSVIPDPDNLLKEFSRNKLSKLKEVFLKTLQTGEISLDQTGPAPGLPQMRKGLAAYISRSSGVEISPEQIVLGSDKGRLILDILSIRELSSPTPKHDGMGLLQLATTISQKQSLAPTAKIRISASESDSLGGVLREARIPYEKTQFTTQFFTQESLSNDDSTILLLSKDDVIGADDINTWLSRCSCRYVIKETMPLPNYPERTIYLSSIEYMNSFGIGIYFAVLPPLLAEEYGRLFQNMNCPVSVLDQVLTLGFVQEQN